MNLDKIYIIIKISLYGEIMNKKIFILLIVLILIIILLSVVFIIFCNKKNEGNEIAAINLYEELIDKILENK